MKKVFSIFISVIIMLSGFTAHAESNEFNITVPDSFTVARKGDSLDGVARNLQMDTAKLSEYFSKNGLVYFAVSADTKTQVRLSEFSDNFSSQVVDICYLKENELNEFIKAVGGENSNELVQNGSRKFVKIQSTLTDSGGDYTVTQYITIANGKTYYLACYNEGSGESAQINEIFKSFSLSSLQTAAEEMKVKMPWYIAGIALFSVATAAGAIRVIISYKKSHQ